MKTRKTILFMLMTILLSISLATPISAQASPVGGKNKEVLVKIVNNSNRYISLVLDHKQEYHVYNLSVAPGVNQYWIYKGNYNYRSDACGKSTDGHTSFREGSKLTFNCH